MKRRIILQALETLHKRIEDTKKASDADPYIDAYAMQNKLIKELIDLLKSNTDVMVDPQLIHWIDRQNHVGSEASAKLQAKQTMDEIDEILKGNGVPKGQMTIDEVMEFISTSKEH